MPDEPDDKPSRAVPEHPFAAPEQWAAMTFDPIRIDPSAFGEGWDKTRGDVARGVIAILSLDDKELTRRFAGDPASDMEALRKTLQMHAEIVKEIDYLKTHIEFLETAATRLLCVASRYEQADRTVVREGDCQGNPAGDRS